MKLLQYGLRFLDKSRFFVETSKRLYKVRIPSFFTQIDFIPTVLI